MHKLLTASALLVVAGTMVSAAPKRDTMPAATLTGKPADCVPINQIQETRVQSDSVIDFHMYGRNKVYRNTLPSSCPTLGSEKRFLYKTSISQLCSVDIITVLLPGGGPGYMRGPSCGLGKFQPVSIDKAPVKS